MRPSLLSQRTPARHRHSKAGRATHVTQPASQPLTLLLVPATIAACRWALSP